MPCGNNNENLCPLMLKIFQLRKDPGSIGNRTLHLQYGPAACLLFYLYGPSLPKVPYVGLLFRTDPRRIFFFNLVVNFLLFRRIYTGFIKVQWKYTSILITVNELNWIDRKKGRRTNYYKPLFFWDLLLMKEFSFRHENWPEIHLTSYHEAASM